jgi:hypothetical protein
MALPPSGALSFSAIGAALCTPITAPYSLRAMSSAAGFTAPDSVSEFYSFTCNSCSISGTSFISTSGGTPVTGTVTIVGSKSIRFQTYGGSAAGSTFNSQLTINSTTYTQNATQNQTLTTNIALTTGSYAFSLARTGFNTSSGGNAQIGCI